MYGLTQDGRRSSMHARWAAEQDSISGSSASVRLGDRRCVAVLLSVIDVRLQSHGELVVVGKVIFGAR